MIKAIYLVLFLQSASTISGQERLVNYGVDVSYPMHYADISKNYHWLPHNLDPSLETPEEYLGREVQPLGDRQTAYDNLINGCVAHYGKKGFVCHETENDRIAMNLRQPQSMMNYTQLGFTKIRAPTEVFELLKEFWKDNRDRALEEHWSTGNSYVNHWERRSQMVNVEDVGHKGGGDILKQKIWNAARDTIQEWTGQRLAECSLYGIRVYEEGAVLATHVDRLPLVSSAIINVDQDVDEPWPLEVIGHDGRAYNVTGRFMANVFVHFEPIGKLGEASIAQGDLPPYVIRGSQEESNWRSNHPDGWTIMDTEDFTTGSTEAHRIAIKQDYALLAKVLEVDPESANAKDTNGWTPLHEAVLRSSEAIMELLIESGADINAVTKFGDTALNLAMQYKGESHSTFELLKSLGGKLGSEL